MLTILSRVLGPDRAVWVYVFFQRWGIGIALGLGFAAVLAGVVVFSSPDRMEHLAYIEAEVIAVAPLMQDQASGVFVDLRLPDGETLKLTETEGAISSSLTETACVEKRRDAGSGEIRYRLRLPHRCAG